MLLDQGGQVFLPAAHDRRHPPRRHTERVACVGAHRRRRPRRHLAPSPPPRHPGTRPAHRLRRPVPRATTHPHLEHPPRHRPPTADSSPTNAAPAKSSPPRCTAPSPRPSPPTTTPGPSTASSAPNATNTAAIVATRPTDQHAELERARAALEHADTEHHAAVDALVVRERERARLGPLTRLRRGGRDDITRADQALAGAQRRLARAATTRGRRARTSRPRRGSRRANVSPGTTNTTGGSNASPRSTTPSPITGPTITLRCGARRRPTRLRRRTAPRRRRHLPRRPPAHRPRHARTISTTRSPARTPISITASTTSATPRQTSPTPAPHSNTSTSDTVSRRDKGAITAARAALDTAEDDARRSRTQPWRGPSNASPTDNRPSEHGKWPSTRRPLNAPDLPTPSRDLSEALDRTRPERIVAATSDPTHELWMSLGPPPTTRGGLAAWCGIAEQLETWNDRHLATEQRPSDTVNRPTTGDRSGLEARSQPDELSLLRTNTAHIINTASRLDPTPAGVREDPRTWQAAAETAQRLLAAERPARRIEHELGLGL